MEIFEMTLTSETGALVPYTTYGAWYGRAVSVLSSVKQYLADAVTGIETGYHALSTQVRKQAGMLWQEARSLLHRQVVSVQEIAKQLYTAATEACTKFSDSMHASGAKIVKSTELVVICQPVK